MTHLPRTITFGLTVFIGLLVLLGVIAISGDRNIFGAATILFDLDTEASIPNWVATVLLLLMATCAAYIASIKTIREARYALQWRYLSIIFLLMSIEEVASLRDRVITPRLRDLLDLDGALYFAWVIPAMLLVLLFVALYARFVWQLPRKTRFFLIIGIMVYVGAAIGLELIGGAVQTDVGRGTVYKLVTIGEESLEFVGILFMLHALMTYLWDGNQSFTTPGQLNSENRMLLLSRYARDGFISMLVVLAIVVGFLLIKPDYVSLSTLHMWDNAPMEAPPLQTPIVFGDDVPFWGAKYSYQADWHLVDINLWWWTQTPPENNYSIGVYLMNEAEQVVAQVDGAIDDVYTNEVEMSQMTPGRIYLDERTLSLPAGLPAGNYSLRLAVYQWWDSVKLSTSDGETLLHLGELSIP